MGFSLYPNPTSNQATMLFESRGGAGQGQLLDKLVRQAMSSEP